MTGVQTCALPISLNAPRGSILSISYIGYKSTEVAAAPSLTVTLKDDSQVLNDVVVIGYGSVKKSDLSGCLLYTSSFKSCSTFRLLCRQ